MHKAYTGKTIRIDIMTDMECAAIDAEYDRVEADIQLGLHVLPLLIALAIITCAILLLVYAIFFVGLRGGL